MRANFLSAVLITMFVSMGCKKETIEELYAEKTGKGSNEVMKVVSASFWRLSQVKLSYANGVMKDSTIDKCNIDDLATYQANGLATIIHGSEFCAVNPPDGRYANWQLLDNGTKIREYFEREVRAIPAGTTREFHIDYVAFKKMVISRNVVDPVNGDYVETTILTR